MAKVPGLQLDDRIFNSDLYESIEAFWFEGLPPGATTPPYSLTARWFGLGSQTEKDQFNSTCSSRFGYVLEAIGPERLALPLPSLDDDKQEDVGAMALPFLLQLEKTATDKCSLKGDDVVFAKSAMSMMIILDQLPRNIYKGSPKMATVFQHYDRLAQALSLTLLEPSSPNARGAFSTLHRPDLHPGIRSRPVYREWFYLPLQHSERLSHHALLSQLISEYRWDITKSGGEAEMKEVDSLADFEDRHVVLLQRYGRYPYRNDVLDRRTTTEEDRWLRTGGEIFGF